MESTVNIDQAGQLVGGAMLGLFAFMALLFVLSLLLFAFWIWMLVDCANSPLPTSDKTAWILILVFTHALGAILYYFIPRRERLSRTPWRKPMPPALP
jgi:uncharacterized BrkB/YihY/UPF0761 family membrane protein